MPKSIDCRNFCNFKSPVAAEALRVFASVGQPNSSLGSARGLGW